MDETTQMQNYQNTYKGMYVDAKGFPSYINQKYVRSLAENPFKLVAIKDITLDEKVYFKKGDTLETRPENFYYRVEYRQANGKIFNLYPRVQMNGFRSGEVVTYPDIHKKWEKDLYTHVTTIYPDPEKGREYTETQEIRAAIKDTFLINDYVAILEDVKRISEIDAQKLTQNEVAVKASIRIIAKNAQTYLAEPILVVNQKESKMANVPEVLPEIGARIFFKNIDTATGKMIFSVDVGEKDYVIMKAMEKPYINLMWIGSLVIVIGMMVALWRRMSSKQQSQEVNTNVSEEELSKV